MKIKNICPTKVVTSINAALVVFIVSYMVSVKCFGMNPEYGPYIMIGGYLWMVLSYIFVMGLEAW